MTHTNHIDEKTLKRYVAGQLSPAAAEVVLSHLETCDICIDRVEALWAETDMGAAIPDVSEEPSDEQASRWNGF